MNLPKLIILDRDGTLNYHSPDPESPLYYVTQPDHLVIKWGAHWALQLIQLHQIPVVMATKQNCIAKKICTREQVDAVNAWVTRLLNVPDMKCYVQEDGWDKGALLQKIAVEHKLLAPQIAVFDDSALEREIALMLGFRAYDGGDLLGSVKALFHVS